MGELFEGWTSWVEDAFLLCKPEDPECLKHYYITRTEEDEPRYTVNEEIAMIKKQIEESEGFDIDFSLFRCLFNYHLVDPNEHDFLEEPENDGDLMKRLSQESLKLYNDESDTKFEFVGVIKANYHWCCGYMFLITFLVSDPSDNQQKPFQARIRYSACRPTEYVFCRPKPDPKVCCTDSSDEDVKVVSDDETSDDETSEEDVKVVSDDETSDDETSEEDVKVVSDDETSEEDVKD